MLIRPQTLKAYLSLYVSEILQKGLEELLQNRNMEDLTVLYDYFEVIGSLGALKDGICKYIRSLSTIICTDSGIPQFIQIIVIC